MIFEQWLCQPAWTHRDAVERSRAVNDCLEKMLFFSSNVVMKWNRGLMLIESNLSHSLWFPKHSGFNKFMHLLQHQRHLSKKCNQRKSTFSVGVYLYTRLEMRHRKNNLKLNWTKEKWKILKVRENTQHLRATCTKRNNSTYKWRFAT